MTEMVGALLGLLVAGGLMLLVVGLRPRPEPVSRERVREPSTSRLWRSGARFRDVVVGAVVGAILAAVSGLPVLVIVCAALGVTGPPLFRQPASVRVLARQEAVETWVRALTGMLTGGVGIEVAIRTSLPSTPPAIRPEVTRLVARLQSQQPLEASLRRWADEMDDRICDLVAGVLIMGAETQHGGLSRALADLSTSVAEENRMMRRIEADRAGTRTVARIVAGISVVMFALVMAGPFGDAYRDLLGQLLLVVFGLAYAAMLHWMTVLSKLPPRPRFLTDPAHVVGSAHP